VSRRTGRRKDISSTMTAGVSYLALYMITAHLSEYLGVEDSEEEDRKGGRRLAPASRQGSTI
jgi:hypothetical protein